jgi:hypothetical protein
MLKGHCSQYYGVMDIVDEKERARLYLRENEYNPDAIRFLEGCIEDVYEPGKYQFSLEEPASGRLPNIQYLCSVYDGAMESLNIDRYFRGEKDLTSWRHLYEADSFRGDLDIFDGIVIDQDCLTVAVNTYIQNPALASEKMSWLLLDLMVMQELSAFSQHISARLGHKNLFGGPKSIVLRGLYQRTARAREAELLVSMLDTYRLLGGRLISPRAVSSAIQEARQAGVIWKNPLYGFIDEVVVMHPRKLKAA